MMFAAKVRQCVARGMVAGARCMHRVFNRCLGRGLHHTLSADARRLLRAFGIVPGTAAYARLNRLKHAMAGHPVSVACGDDATLLVEGYHGFNIIYCQDHYYAWPQSAGGFSPQRFVQGAAPDAVEEGSLADVRSAVDARICCTSDDADADAAWRAAEKALAAVRNSFRSRENIARAPEVIDSLPTVLIVSTAIGCNIRCRMCYLSSDHNLSYKGVKGDRQMSEVTFARVQELLPTTRDLIITVEGEILLHRKWVDRWFALIKEYPNLRLSMQTNGMLMTDEAIEKILSCPRITQVAFSIDGATPEVNDAIRVGAKLKVVIDGIRRLLAARRQRGMTAPNVHTHFVMMRENIHELPAYIQRMAELGVDSMSARHLIAYHKDQIGYSLYFDQARCDEMILRARKVVQKCGVAADLPKTFAESEKLTLADRPKCLDPWRHGQILHDGSVFSCCNNAILMGNINDAGGFEGVWNNEKYRDLRKTINQAVSQFTLCKYCNAMLPVNLFEAHVYTKMLFELIRNGGLEKYCPGPVNLLVRPDEVIVE